MGGSLGLQTNWLELIVSEDDPPCILWDGWWCSHHPLQIQGLEWQRVRPPWTTPWSYVREEQAVSCRWTGWVREISSWSSRFQEIFTDNFGGIYRICLKQMKAKAEDRCQHATGWILITRILTDWLFPKASRAPPQIVSFPTSWTRRRCAKVWWMGWEGLVFAWINRLRLHRTLKLTAFLIQGIHVQEKGVNRKGLVQNFHKDID